MLDIESKKYPLKHVVQVVEFMHVLQFIESLHLRQAF